MCDKCLKWSSKEISELSSKVLTLEDSQIEKLFEKVGISFSVPMSGVINEIRNELELSTNLHTLLLEANSKKDLLKWIKYFEDK